MSDRGLLLRAALRTDFVCFFEKCFLTIEPGTIYQDNWHIHAVAHALQRVWAGELKRLVINVPPRSGKSIITSIAYAAWVLGHDPTRRIICVSHSDVLAKTHASEPAHGTGSFFQTLRFGTEMETITTLHGYRYAVSMAGSVMGRRADLIIGDDPMSSVSAPSEAVRKTEVNLWMTAHRTRLNNKREGAIVLVMQRLHQNDLVGHVLRSEDWEVLSIPAIATDPAAYRIGPDSEDVYNRQLNEVLHPEREPLDVLEATRRKSALPEMPVAGPCAMAGRPAVGGPRY